uniref:Uncharacterized protein n=1 Tax=Glossina pallidipes TaxID=7398 RepID=A0A1A9ZVL1_GLOPL
MTERQTEERMPSYVAIGMQPGCMIMIIAIDLIGIHNAAHLSASMTSCQIDIDSFDKFHIGGSEIIGNVMQRHSVASEGRAKATVLLLIAVVTTSVREVHESLLKDASFIANDFPCSL